MPGVGARPVARTGDDDQAPVASESVLDTLPGPLIDEQAVPQHGRRSVAAHAHGQRADPRRDLVSLSHVGSGLRGHRVVVPVEGRFRRTAAQRAARYETRTSGTCPSAYTTWAP